MNRRDIFRSSLIAPAVAAYAVAKAEASPLTAVQALPIPLAKRPFTGNVQWDQIAQEALERLQVRLLGIDLVGEQRLTVPNTRIGYTVNLGRWPQITPVTMDTLYADLIDNLSDDVIATHSHWDIFKMYICPMVDRVANQIVKDCWTATVPTFVNGRLELPGGLNVAESASIKDKLSLRLLRGVVVTECREEGAECELFYDIRSNTMVPVKKPFSYDTRIDVLGGFPRS